MRRSSIWVLVGTLACAGPPSAVQESQVEWIAESTHPVLWSRISSAFIQEVRDSITPPFFPPPNPPRGIEWVVLQDSTALVFLRYADDPEWSLHSIYSYRLETGEKRPLGTWGGLEHEGVANFEVSVPDIVFRYVDCFECRSTLLLSSLKYDNEEWSVRTWVKDGEARKSVMIGSMPQDGNDYIWSSACAHRIWDGDFDGADELAVYCRGFGHDWETDEIEVQEDHVVWYDLVNGQMEGEEVDSPESRVELYRAVCTSYPKRTFLFFRDLCSN